MVFCGLSDPEYSKKSVDMAQQWQVCTQKVSGPELVRKMSTGVFNIRACRNRVRMASVEGPPNAICQIQSSVNRHPHEGVASSSDGMLAAYLSLGIDQVNTDLG